MLNVTTLDAKQILTMIGKLKSGYMIRSDSMDDIEYVADNISELSALIALAEEASELSKRR